MISAKLLFASITFCLLWIWLFSSTSQNVSKRSLNVKTNTFERADSFSNYLVDNRSHAKDLFSTAKPVENFAGVSFEVIPTSKNGDIFIRLFTQSGDGTIILIGWENEQITVQYNTEKIINSTFKNKFTFELKLVSYVLRAQICSNYNCGWSYVNYQKLKRTNFDRFFITISAKNPVFIRNFKLQKFLVSQKAAQYFPLQVSNDKNVYEAFPTPKNFEIKFFLKNFRQNKTNNFLCMFYLANNVISLLKIFWDQWPSVFTVTLDNGISPGPFPTLYIPYTDIFNDWLTVRLYIDSNDTVIMEACNQNITVPASYNSLEKIDRNSLMSVFINSDEGSLNETSDTYYSPGNTNDDFYINLPKTAVYLIAFKNITTSLNATIGSNINGCNINVIQIDGKINTDLDTSTIIFNQKTATITHDSTNLKPDVEIVFETSVIYMFTSDGKNAEVESGIPPEFFNDITVQKAENVWIQVNTIALVK